MDCQEVQSDDEIDCQVADEELQNNSRSFPMNRVDKMLFNNNQYSRALNLYQEKKYVLAAELFSGLIESDSLLGRMSRFYAGQSYLCLALEQLRDRDFQPAIKHFNLAARLNPHDASLSRYLASCYAQLGRIDRASRHADREAGLLPHQTDPAIRSALCFWKDGQQLRAIQMLRDGVLTQPHQVEWHFQLGLFHAAKEEYESAIESFDAVIQQRPMHTQAHVHLALCWGARCRPELAVKHLAIAQQQYPDDAQIGLFLAMAASAQSNVSTKLNPIIPVAKCVLDAGVIQELSEMVLLDSEVVEAFVCLPETTIDQDIFELLAAVLERAILIEPRRADLRYQQAQVYKRLRRPEQAINCCERAVEIFPEHVQALITLGKLYQETDRHQEAVTRLQHVLDMGYEYADVHYALGCIYRDQGQPERAKIEYQRALTINANYQAARRALDSIAA